jgi:Co/Zn/Cd efflux system component
VLAINAAMFLVEIGAGVAAGSASLQADALDFFGDAANYAISLLVVGMVLRYRALAALAKGSTMGLFGLWIIGTAVWHALHGTLPNAYTMGAIGFAALAANAISFGLLWAYRDGDANMRSAWICTIWRCCSLPLACLAPVQAGRMLSLPRSWRASPCKGRGW